MPVATVVWANRSVGNSKERYRQEQANNKLPGTDRGVEISDIIHFPQFQKRFGTVFQPKYRRKVGGTIVLAC